MLCRQGLASLILWKPAIMRFWLSLETIVSATFLWRSHRFVPAVCKYTVHERCVARAAQNCIETYSKTGHAVPYGKMKHHWVRTQLRTAKDTEFLGGWQLSWKVRSVQAFCENAWWHALSLVSSDGQFLRDLLKQKKAFLGTYTLHATDSVHIAWNTCVSSAAAHCSRSFRSTTGQSLLKPLACT